MYVREEVPVEAVLKGSAAKVLLHLLRHRHETQEGAAGLSNAEIMRGSGVHDRNTYFKAKKQLSDLGLWENPDCIFHTVGGNTHTVGGTVGGNTHTEYEGKPIRPSSGRAPYGFTERQWQDYEQSDQQNPMATDLPEIAHIPEPRNYRAEAMQADLMPTGTGPEHQRTSEFQARRRVQVALLQDAWREMFGTELQVDGARRYLALADNYAEDVLEAFEKAQSPKVRSKYTWILRVLEAKAQERRETEARTAPTVAAPGTGVHGSGVRPVNISRPGGAAGSLGREGEDDNYYRKPPPDVQRKMDMLKRAMAAGVISSGEDDDWDE